MADVNYLISLGVGAPADIPHFVLFGLTPSTGAMLDVLDLCDTSVRSLTPFKGVASLKTRRALRSLTAERTVDGLTPRRIVRKHCEGAS